MALRLLVHDPNCNNAMGGTNPRRRERTRQRRRSTERPLAPLSARWYPGLAMVNKSSPRSLQAPGALPGTFYGLPVYSPRVEPSWEAIQEPGRSQSKNRASAESGVESRLPGRGDHLDCLARPEPARPRGERLPDQELLGPDCGRPSHRLRRWHLRSQGRHRSRDGGKCDPLAH